MPSVVGAILAGGASRRMGAPKALVVVDGTALGDRVATALRGGGVDRIVLVGGEQGWADELDLPLVPDRWPGQGPLGALATALLAAEDAEALVVAACDQPALRGSTVSALVAMVQRAAAGPAAAAVRTPDGRRHPFPSAWRPSAGPLIAELVAAGHRRADAGFGVVPTADVAGAGEDLVDLDAPGDVERWERTRSSPRRSDRA